MTVTAAGVAVSQKLMAENALLRESIQELNQQVTQANGEYWRWVAFMHAPVLIPQLYPCPDMLVPQQCTCSLLHHILSRASQSGCLV